MEKYEILLKNQYFHDINPVVAGWEHCPPGGSFGPTRRPYMLLHYIVSGEGFFFSNGTQYQVGQGQIFVIRPGETTVYSSSKDHPLYYIWIGFEAKVSLPCTLEQDVLFLPEANTLFSSLLEIPNLSTGREAFLCGKIWELLSMLDADGISIDRNHVQTNDYVAIAKNYIEAEFARKLSVAEIAQYLHLDRSYFSRIFRLETGFSPQQYLIHCRMQKAVELLRNGGKSPGEVAVATGYSDISSFSRAFKQYFGCSPTEFQLQKYD